MPVGPSGRIVIEIDPDTKRELHEALRADELSLRDWFLIQATAYLSSRGQLSLRFQAADAGKVKGAGDEVPT